MQLERAAPPVNSDALPRCAVVSRLARRRGCAGRRGWRRGRGPGRRSGRGPGTCPPCARLAGAWRSPRSPPTAAAMLVALSIRWGARFAEASSRPPHLPGRARIRGARRRAGHPHTVAAPAVLFRYGVLAARNAAILAPATYIRPPLALAWLLLAGRVDVARLDLLVVGTTGIACANLMASGAASRPSHAGAALTGAWCAIAMWRLLAG